jgi:hypothetical protein
VVVVVMLLLLLLQGKSRWCCAQSDAAEQGNQGVVRAVSGGRTALAGQLIM